MAQINVTKPGLKKQVVYGLLARSQKYRDNDRLLILAVWAREGFHLSEEQRKDFMKVTDASRIKRIRREARGDYPGSPEVEAKRYKRFKEIKDEYAGSTKHSKLAVSLAERPERKDGKSTYSVDGMRPEMPTKRGFMQRIFKKKG